ncbi:RNA-binding KH domain-containing protein [Striga hermonthica]|uniref:RNA-binding KH domain-containing protein n=1 Tax=Striga hermonthica TaxID=68872 RepID=A0A9N7RMA5_STRHE|nr:RNA-binding KH domain-containing protein [Striga hermonthica]
MLPWAVDGSNQETRKAASLSLDTFDQLLPSPFAGAGANHYLKNRTQARSTFKVSPAMELEIMPPKKPNFDPLKAHEITEGRQAEFRKVPVPAHRLKPLKAAWDIIYNYVYEVMNVDIRMNLKARRVELKNKPETPDIGHLQRCSDFVHAFVLGFELRDAKLMLKHDELYIDSFEIRDVKRLRGEHLSRAVGRLSGKSGKTKFAIENATKTRIVIADTRIHVMGPFARIKIARSCLCSLIMGSPAARVYSKLRLVASRLDSMA